jgi:hypothetical protein
MSFLTLLFIFTFYLTCHCYVYHQSPLRTTYAGLRYTGQIISSHDVQNRNNNQLSRKEFSPSRLNSKVEDKETVDDLAKVEEIKEPSAFDQVASKGLAGVLAIAAAEA